MCGITGYLSAVAESDTDKHAQVTRMARRIRHRGPDEEGIWTDAEAGLAFGHRRLAIVDLTQAGSQPMAASGGRFMMVYNGEIYNHTAIREALEESGCSPAWRGHSDTETLLAGFEAWGIRETIARAVGMFAIAVWDKAERRLVLIRDRLGEKPLYYGWQGTGQARAFLFGSELKSLAVHPAFEGQIDRSALPELLRHGHVGEDRSIYRNIHKVRPGEIVSLSLERPEPVNETYWSGADVACRGADDPHFVNDPEGAVDALDTLLTKIVGGQMMADVPLGAFLSGGIDSSTIVALMQKQSSDPVHTFSIGFNEARYNEAEHARAVAAHLGTRHTDLYIDEATLLDIVPLLPRMYDEPHADSSQIPTYLVAKLARAHVTVALSGDGGDELFSGYDRYAQGARLLAGLGRLPRGLRAGMAFGVKQISTRALDRLMEPIRPTPQGKEPNGQRLHRLADYLTCQDTDDLHRMLVSRWRHPQGAVPETIVPPTLLDQNAPARGSLSDMARMQQLDMLTYLPDDILAKVDRATMAVSLESRAPLLDHRVVEFACRLPDTLKRRDGLSKWALRQVLYRYVPAEITDRPKMGFEVPIGLWLRGPLKDWAGDLLSHDRLAADGWFDPDTIRRTWAEHLEGRANHGLALWPVLMFQSWLGAGGAHAE